MLIPAFLEVKNLELLDLRNNTEMVKYMMSPSSAQWKSVYSLEKAQRIYIRAWKMLFTQCES